MLKTYSKEQQEAPDASCFLYFHVNYKGELKDERFTSFLLLKLNEAIVEEFDDIIEHCRLKINAQKTIDFSKSVEEVETVTKIIDNTFEYRPHDKRSDAGGKDEPLEIPPKPRTGSKIEFENDNNILQIDEVVSNHKSYFPFEEYSAKYGGENKISKKEEQKDEKILKFESKERPKGQSYYEPEDDSEDEEDKHVVEKFEKESLSKSDETNERSEKIQK